MSRVELNRQLQLPGRALRHMAKFYDAPIPQLNLKSAETREPKERIREMTWAEQARLFSFLRSDLHPLVKFALMTGARCSTITGLQWSDVDLNAGSMKFRIKGDDEMTFPINREVRAFLVSLPRSNTLAFRSYVVTYVDQVTLERKPIGISGKLGADFKAATRAAEIEDFRFHDLRHTFATRMLRKTDNLKMTSRFLGHKSIETTMRYAHVLDSDLRDALDDFSALEKPESHTYPHSMKHN
ncbi:tyrosine-type recombinase/integrase [Candidatus Halocynthiibacter alkanivorans]|uniref:tyrosine-type recombinase/integrase n=1 Tax=Candidatus Halocynthiibacter alkanivorans TaxID=2267619 RepID=UPI000DF38361|nr:site-specific integrase [Candidatus Halocynthiibacter alkanivorans]